MNGKTCCWPSTTERVTSTPAAWARSASRVALSSSDLGAAGGDVEPRETGEVGVQRVRQRGLRVDRPVAEDAGDHAFEQRDGDQGVGGVVGHQRLARVLHVEPRRERDDPPGQRLAPLLERQGDGDGEVPAGGVADGRDVGGRDRPLGERHEGGDTVVDLRGVRVLGRPAVVEDEGRRRRAPWRGGAASLRWLDAEPTAKPPPWV